MHRDQEERIERRQERQEDRAEHREERAERREDRTDHGSDVVFHPGRPTKILYSPGTGAGWITYAPKNASDNFLVWMLTYEPLIRSLENRAHKDRLEELLKDFHREAHVKFGVERIMCARVGDLAVYEVRTPFEVRENDGAERVVDVSRSGGDVGRRRIVPMGAVVY